MRCDYCDGCYRELSEGRERDEFTRHREAIRTVLDKATPVILSHPLPDGEQVVPLPFA